MQINARDWQFEVSEDPDSGTPTWARVAGLESFTLSNSEGEESAETTSFESEGHAESQAMQRGASLALEGKARRDAAGVPDSGQGVCDALAVKVGEDSLGGVRFRHDTDDEWTVWTAWVSKGDTAGGNNDKTSWSSTFTRSGKPTTTPVAG